MTYKIVFLTNRNSTAAQRILDAVGRKFDRDYSVETVGSYKDAADKAKFANALLFETQYLSSDFNAVKHSLGLYADVHRVKAYPAMSRAFGENGLDIMTVCDVPMKKAASDSGFANNTAFGREAYDTIRYSELEIERVARIAYELAETRSRHVTLADGDGRDRCSGLWRKIVTDINEDYPFVRVDLEHTSDVCAGLIEGPARYDVILTASAYGKIISRVSSAICNGAVSYSALGDTPLGAYGTQNDPIGSILSVASMLRHSLDMREEAECLKTALSGAAENRSNFISDDFVDGVISRI